MNILRRCFKKPLSFLLDTSWVMVAFSSRKWCFYVLRSLIKVYLKKKGLTVKTKAKQVCKPQT